MILGLFIESAIFILLSIFFFWKKKPVLGGLFALIGIAGAVIGLIVIYLFPEKI